MKRNLKFGVEIEFFGIDRNRVADALNRAGIRAFVEGYNHATRGYWKLTTDGSVNSQGTGNGHGGNELVSPPLEGEDGLRELELALKILNECGGKVDKSCGIHIHHEIKDLDLTKIQNIYRLYFKFTASIDYLMPPSRRSTNNPYYCKPISLDLLERVENCGSIEALQSMFLNNRYWAVNFDAYNRYKTIEFRQHSGSIDFEKVGSWVRITHKIIEKACAGWRVEVAKDNSWRVCDSNWWFRQLVGKELETYVVNRMNYWKERERTATTAA
jgi:hypothetical protein